MPELSEKDLLVLFGRLNNVGAAQAFPPATTLSTELTKLIPPSVPADKFVTPTTAAHFITAAVEIWLRGVHSFLISAALTESSPIWACVAGYYSSHYTVRGIAHLLGYFQLFHSRRIVELRIEGGRFICNFRSKQGGGAEHKFYWKTVKHSERFESDGLFTENKADEDSSDVWHRNRANYADHLNIYPQFAPLDEQSLKDRIDFISKIVFDAPPLPRADNFPDVEYVQLAAYHRIVRVRKLLDSALGTTNRFWNVHRNPPLYEII